jgi:hypothetical protein
LEVVLSVFVVIDILMLFKEPVEAVFIATEPLTVNDSRRLSLMLYPYEIAFSGQDYVVPFAITNESGIIFNMVTLTFN